MDIPEVLKKTEVEVAYTDGFTRGLLIGGIIAGTVAIITSLLTKKESE